MSRLLTPSGGVLVSAFLLIGLVGCDALGDVFGTELEATGIVEEVGSDFLTVDATHYAVNDQTKYVGYTGLSAIRVGDEVKIEYQDQGGERLAVEVENLSGSGGFEITYAPPFHPNAFVDEITNPFFPLAPGTTYRYVGQTAGGEEVILVEVLDETRDIVGVTTRVVHDSVFLDGELIEDTYDWYAQDMDGNVWYLGEATEEYEGGVVVSTAGSWEPGVDGAIPGIVMPAEPAVGQAYRQEFYAGEAEDQAEVLSTSESVTVPLGSYTNCVKTYDTTPLDPDAQEHKYYCSGVGNVLTVDLLTGERDELVEVTTN